MSGDSCLGCRFFKATRAEHGQCRRSAPQPNTQSSEIAKAFWPVVEDVQWCGEFQRRVPPADPAGSA